MYAIIDNAAEIRLQIYRYLLLDPPIARLGSEREVADNVDQEPDWLYADWDDPDGIDPGFGPPHPDDHFPLNENYGRDDFDEYHHYDSSSDRFACMVL